MEHIINKAKSIKQILGLNTFPVGVQFIFNKENYPDDAVKIKQHRYCQALMKARHGDKVLLDAEGLSCPAAAAAFGFKPLPKGLKTGKGLMGFGIVEAQNTGKTMFEGMTTLEQGTLQALYLFPLEKASIEPDIVVVEDQTEKLMWIALANLNVKGGQRIESSTAILQATCVDATTIPYIEQKFNMSMGCYGCRDATDIDAGETVLGFPFKDFKDIAENLEFLNQKAIPNSRGKNAYAMLKRKEAEGISKTDPFQD